MDFDDYLPKGDVISDDVKSMATCCHPKTNYLYYD